ncbi:MAG: hypothetical protein AAGB51_13640 [Planctomycetota bacterium]
MRPLLLILLLFALAGCRTGSGIEAVGLAPTESGGLAAVEARFPIAIYDSPSPGTAEIYLTDLPLEAFDAGFPASQIRGQLVQITLFVTPNPTQTPISDNATNAVIRHAIFAGDGERELVGIYEGAGFVLPSGDPGKNRFRGDMNGGSTVLLFATEGFPDLLGATSTSLWFDAKLDPPRCTLLRRRLNTARAESVQLQREEGDPFR